jgi:hypothetical protein
MARMNANIRLSVFASIRGFQKTGLDLPKRRGSAFWRNPEGDTALSRELR